KTREKLRAQLREGKLDSRLVEMEVREKSFPTIEVAGPQGVEEMGINMKDMLGNLFQGRTKRQRMRVDEALEYIIQEEEERLVDMDTVARAALERVESNGIIFLDELSVLGPDLEPKRQLIDAEYVSRTLSDIAKDQDLSRYIL